MQLEMSTLVHVMLTYRLVSGFANRLLRSSTKGGSAGTKVGDMHE